MKNMKTMRMNNIFDHMAEYYLKNESLPKFKDNYDINKIEDLIELFIKIIMENDKINWVLESNIPNFVCSKDLEENKVFGKRTVPKYNFIVRLESKDTDDILYNNFFEISYVGQFKKYVIPLSSNG